jgi:signal recognition particle subunit SRP14
MVHLSTDAFLNELSRLFKRHEAGGSVWVTLKRSSMRPTPRKQPPAKTKAGKSKQPPAKRTGPLELVCLVRATDGDKKITTTVGAADFAKFQASYTLILKANMDALKKRAKKGGEAGKRAAAKKH